MRGLGIFLTFAGIIWALIAFNMDTTVTSDSETYGSGANSIYVPSVTVNNLGLMETRRNNLMFAGLTILVGVVLTGFGSLSKSSPSTDPTLKACPFCAERIQPIALKCRYCNSDLPDSFRTLPTNFSPDTAKDRLKMQVAQIRQGSAPIESYMNVVASLGGTLKPQGSVFDVYYIVDLDGITSRVNTLDELRQWFLDNVVRRVSGW